MCDTPSIWIGPASKENLNLTIRNTYQNEYCWAFNGTKSGRNKFDSMQVGDICIFGNLIEGYNYYGIVKQKHILTENESLIWPFRSKSGTNWIHKFVINDVNQCNILPEQARHFRGWTNSKQTWQTQTILKKGKGYEEFYNYICGL